MAIRAREMLAAMEDSDARASRERLYIRTGALGADAEAPLASGVEAFWERVVTRVLREHGGEVFVRRCARCDALCRTPLARQCLMCGHDWHGETS